MIDCIKKLKPFAERGVPIVGLEPSAVLGFRDEAPDLMPAGALREDALCVREQSQTIEEFLIAHADELQLAGWKAPAEKVLVHEHCHAKSLLGPGITEQAMNVFPGWSVERINSGCCGMAGSFGYEKEHFDVSMRIGEQILFPALRKTEASTLICAPGTSCRHQILDGTQREALHPVEILLSGFSSE